MNSRICTYNKFRFSYFFDFSKMLQHFECILAFWVYFVVPRILLFSYIITCCSEHQEYLIRTPGTCCPNSWNILFWTPETSSHPTAARSARAAILPLFDEHVLPTTCSGCSKRRTCSSVWLATQKNIVRLCDSQYNKSKHHQITKFTNITKNELWNFYI